VPVVQVSVGELIDKITILEIKSERINSQDKLDNVNKELEALKPIEAKYPEVAFYKLRLKAINESLWDIEDAIRVMERNQSFGEEFIDLARSVYFTNDKRAEIKKQINAAAGSEIVEEKSYEDTGEMI
jgi:hypothetical protein